MPNPIYIVNTENLILLDFRLFVQRTRKMTCISRKDKDMNIFSNEMTLTGRRWNLYSQILIENDTLVCADETYLLTEICFNSFRTLPCTLHGTNEIVDISWDSQ